MNREELEYLQQLKKKKLKQRAEKTEHEEEESLTLQPSLTEKSVGFWHPKEPSWMYLEKHPIYQEILEWTQRCRRTSV